jgi:UDP-glucose 4-epimerase
MKGKNVLVTGGAGFIGSHLVEYLVNEGCKVTVVDNLASGRLENLKTSINSIRFYEMDLLSERIYAVLEETHFDYIFHLAANAYVPPSVENPEYDFNNTLLTTFRLLEYIRKNKYNTVFIAISSAAIYGSPDKMPIYEHFTPDPISPYGVSKLALENYVRVFANLYGIKCASLRLFSVYGPRQIKQIVYDFMVKLKNNPNEMEIIGDGSQMRDIIYVKDVLQALTLISTKGDLKGEWYNVANGNGYSTLELAKIMCELLSVCPKFKYTGDVRAGDADKWIANIDKMKNLGYSIKYPIYEGLKETIEWYKYN